jgi:hypothetical protein
MRELIYKAAGEEVISDEFASRLRAPVDGEAAALDELAKAGATSAELDAACGAWRLLASLRQPLAKALRLPPVVSQASYTSRLQGGAEPVTSAELLGVAKQHRLANDAAAEGELDRLADRVRKEEPTLSKEQAYTRALQSDRGRELYARMQRNKLRKAGVDVDTDLEPAGSSDLSTELEKAASRILSSQPELTREQAVAEALRENPDLYRRS